MASVLEELLIRFVIDSASLKSGLSAAVEGIKNADQNLTDTSQSVTASTENLVKTAADGLDKVQEKSQETSKVLQKTGQEFERMSAGWRGAIVGFVKSVVAPVTGALAVGSVIQGYFSGVAEVAQMTGAYSTQLEEWRKKRALLARVNKEDIEAYRKGRETLTRFNIVMADLGTNIMRAALPAIRYLIDTLGKITDWVDRNQNNIVRFLTVTAGVIATLLIPSFIKLTAAMLTNPFTWLVVGITALALIIDDLVTYVHGGESAFADFWALFGDKDSVVGNLVKTLASLAGTAALLFANFKIARGGFLAFEVATNTVINVVRTGYDILSKFGGTIRVIASVISGKAVAAVQLMITAVRALTTAIMANPLGLIITLAVAALVLLWQNWDNVVASFKSGLTWIKEKFAEFMELIDPLIQKFNALAETISNTFSFDNIKQKVAGLVDWMPDWMKPDDLKNWAAEVQKGAQNTSNANTAQIATRTSNRNQNISNNNEINIYTNANNPQAIGQQVQNAVMQANNSNASSVAASESGVR